MFGMENKKPKGSVKGKKEVFLFDLERELRDKEKQREYVRRIEGRVGKNKELLRKGSKKEEFDSLGILLNGYHALAIVLGRAASR
jgi:hypothetical protein